MSVCPNGTATDKTFLLEGFLLHPLSLRAPWLLPWGCTSPKYSTYETETQFKTQTLLSAARSVQQNVFYCCFLTFFFAHTIPLGYCYFNKRGGG